MNKADISVQKTRDGYQVVAASLWDNKTDCTGVLEGMLGEVYKTKAEIRESVRELVGSNKVKVAIDIVTISILV